MSVLHLRLLHPLPTCEIAFMRKHILHKNKRVSRDEWFLYDRAILNFILSRWVIVTLAFPNLFDFASVCFCAYPPPNPGEGYRKCCQQLVNGITSIRWNLRYVDHQTTKALNLPMFLCVFLRHHGTLTRYYDMTPKDIINYLLENNRALVESLVAQTVRGIVERESWNLNLYLAWLCHV